MCFLREAWCSGSTLVFRVSGVSKLNHFIGRKSKSIDYRILFFWASTLQNKIVSEKDLGFIWVPGIHISCFYLSLFGRVRVVVSLFCSEKIFATFAKKHVAQVMVPYYASAHLPAEAVFLFSSMPTCIACCLKGASDPRRICWNGDLSFLFPAIRFLIILEKGMSFTVDICIYIYIFTYTYT